MCGKVVQATLVRYTDGIIDHTRRLNSWVIKAALALRGAFLLMYADRIIKFVTEAVAIQAIQDTS